MLLMIYLEVLSSKPRSASMSRNVVDSLEKIPKALIDKFMKLIFLKSLLLEENSSLYLVCFLNKFFSKLVSCPTVSSSIYRCLSEVFIKRSGR